MASEGIVDLTISEDEDDLPAPPQGSQRPQRPPRTSNVGGKLFIEISDEDSESSPTPTKPSSARRNPLPRSQRPNPRIPSPHTINGPSVAIPGDVPTRGRVRNLFAGNNQAFKENNAGPVSVKSSTLSASATATPPRATKSSTVLKNSSGPQVKGSPQYPSLNRQTRTSARLSPQEINDDESPRLRERAGNVPRPSLLGSPKAKLVSEPASSARTTPRASSRFTNSGINFSKLVEETTLAASESKTQSVSGTPQSQSENEKAPQLEEDSDEEAINPALPAEEIQPQPDLRPKKTSRINHASQSTIPDSSNSVASSSPIKASLAERRKNVQPTSSPRRRTSVSPRVEMRRNNLWKGKEPESSKSQQTHTIKSLEESLRSFEQSMKELHAVTVRHLLGDAREAEVSREHLFMDAVSPFASMKGIQLQPNDPVPKGAYVQKLDSYVQKGKGYNNTTKATKIRSIIVAQKIKSEISRVPKYSSHTFVQRNTLSADEDKLRFVPYLGDVDTKESNKRRLEKDLAEAYTAERSESSRVSEELSILRGYIDSWLEKLDIGCTKRTMEHFILSQDDEIDDAGLGKKARKVLLKSFGPALTSEDLTMASKLSQAFENVFDQPLAKVLLPADRLKEMTEAAKKSDRKSLDTPTKSLSAHLETFAALSCLICGAMECQSHGHYEWPMSPNGMDSDDEVEQPEYQYEKKNISLQADDMIRRYEERLTNESKETDSDAIDVPEEPCGKQCYQLKLDRGDYEFTAKNIDDLRHMLFTWEEEAKDNLSCNLATIMSLPCWQIYNEIQKIENEREIKIPGSPVAGRVKRPDWYDNKKKTLKHGFEDMTKAHLHQERSSMNPCAHPGRPCDSDCPCVRANILCEILCGCLDDCPRKFTGCDCSSYGRSCGSETCICIQMNRECGPQCVSCGAVSRLDPKNKFDDALFMTGCQSIALSRGVPKHLVMGESQLEGTGFGLYAAEPIRKGEFVSEYGGEIISTTEADRRGIIYDRKYLSFLFDLNSDWAIDAARLGNKTRFINHADNEKDGLNCEAKILFVNGEHRIKFQALCNIKEGEELLFNYGKKFAEKHGLSKKLPKIKEKKGVVVDDALDELDGVASRKRTSTNLNARGNLRGMRGMRGRGSRGGRGRGRARKSAPMRMPEVETEVEVDDEMPDVEVYADEE
ncbi:Histone-lysine N-methyltransferase EZH2, partial [Lachnellula suecica]